jgi:hypothetical protein
MPRLVEPTLSRLQFTGCRVTVALCLSTGACEFRLLAARFGKLSLEVLDPALQEPLLLGNAGKLPLGSLERARSRFHVGFSRLDCLGSAARLSGRILPGP